MIRIVIVLCLQGQCVERPIVPAEPVGLFECLAHGELAGVRFLADHPALAARGWRLARWRCEIGRREERGA